MAATPPAPSAPPASLPGVEDAAERRARSGRGTGRGGAHPLDARAAGATAPSPAVNATGGYDTPGAGSERIEESEDGGGESSST